MKTANRKCDQCGATMPNRTHRQRNEKGQQVCESCKANPQPQWTTTHSSLSILDQSEMRRREAEALTSLVRVRQAKHAGRSVVAHDGGDQAVVHHCPFCGSGAVVGNSDGSASCDFCHSSFTVQVQPAHPFMPQTIDGEPVVPPGMPGGEETELSAPSDPAVEEDAEDVAADPLGDANPSSADTRRQQQGPPKPPQPPKKPGGDGDNKPPWLKDKKKSSAKSVTCPVCSQEGTVEGDRIKHRWSEKEDHHGEYAYRMLNDHKRSSRTVEVYRHCAHCGEDSDLSGPCPSHRDGSGHAVVEMPVSDPEAFHQFDRKAFRTADGRTIDEEAYMARLALENADDREAVLEQVRVANMQREAKQSAFAEPEYVMCPHCQQEMTWWEDSLGNRCPHCGRTVTSKPAPTPEELDEDHRVVSVGGWTCDICGHGVNGQTNDLGEPVQSGDSVRHTGSRREAASVTCPRCKGEGDTSNGVECDVCHGTGTVEDSGWMSRGAERKASLR